MICTYYRIFWFVSSEFKRYLLTKEIRFHMEKKIKGANIFFNGKLKKENLIKSDENRVLARFDQI